jgi:hypothetical protein
MSAAEPVARPFVGKDNLDEVANDPNDVLQPPQDYEIHDDDEKHVVFRLSLPPQLRNSARKMLKMQDKMKAKWVGAPRGLADLIPRPDGADDNDCCFRVSGDNTLATWACPGWSQADRPREGDIFVEGRRTCCPVDQLAFAYFFLQTPAPAHYYVARPWNRLDQATLDDFQNGVLVEEAVLVDDEVNPLVVIARPRRRRR